MNVRMWLWIAVAAMTLAACETGSGGAPAGVDRAKYERHKANRESYMYQGL